MANETKFRGNLTVTGQSNSPVYTVTYASSITINWNNGPKQVVTMTGDPEFQTPTNIKDGANYVLYLIQDGTGSRSPTFADEYWLFKDAVWPTFSSAANAIDILHIEARGGYLHVTPGLNYKRYIPA